MQSQRSGINGAPHDPDIVLFGAAPGDVIIHQVRTVHGAGVNPFPGRDHA